MKRKYLIYIIILLMVLVVIYFIFRKNDVTIEEDVYTDDLIKEELLAMINSDKVSSKITSIMHGMDKINLMDTDVSIVNGEIKITDKNGLEINKKIDNDSFYKMVGYNDKDNGYVYILTNSGYVYYFDLDNKDITKLNFSNVDELLVVDVFRTYIDTGKEESDKIIYLVSSGKFVEVK